MHAWKLVIKPNITMMTMIFVAFANYVVSKKFAEHIRLNLVFLVDSLEMDCLKMYCTTSKQK